MPLSPRTLYMNRRTFVVSALSVSLPAGAAGCLGGDGEDEEDDPEPESGVSREVVIDSENLLRRADSLIRQDGTVFVTVRLENAGTEPVSAEVTLRIRETGGGALGDPLTQQRGPIAPGRTVQMRFETALDPNEVSGYTLTITETDSGDGSSGTGSDSGNETQKTDRRTELSDRKPRR